MHIVHSKRDAWCLVLCIHIVKRDAWIGGRLGGEEELKRRRIVLGEGGKNDEGGHWWVFKIWNGLTLIKIIISRNLPSKFWHFPNWYHSVTKPPLHKTCQFWNFPNWYHCTTHYFVNKRLQLSSNLLTYLLCSIFKSTLLLSQGLSIPTLLVMS